MAHSHSHCPVCNNPIRERSLETCDRCGWILAVENLLESQYYDMLVDWASRSYEKIAELEGRGKYRQEKLNQRLDSQRKDIDLLQKQIDTLCDRLPEIKSILETNPVNTEPEDKDTESTGQSIERGESTPTEEEQHSNDRERESEIPITPSADLNNTDSDESQLPQIYQSINSEYFHDIGRFAQQYNVLVVSVNKESIERSRGNEDKTVIFEETNRGSYWLFNIDEIAYLAPVADKYINPHSHTTTALSFECHNYTPDYNKIQLVKPAIVSIDSHTNPTTWRLQERGEIVFL